MRFVSGEAHVLVATTVIEVGIDVPNATVMLVEGAERFGLSQLHQLRGRVGRGEHESFCILFGDPESEAAKARLEAIAGEGDGFALAEVDLTIRGEGEILGTRQHGLPRFRAASLPEDTALLLEARRRVLELRDRFGSLEAPGDRPADGRGPPALRRRAGRADRGVRWRVRITGGELRRPAHPRSEGREAPPDHGAGSRGDLLDPRRRRRARASSTSSAAPARSAIEALSRGASGATLVDTRPQAQHAENVEELGLTDRAARHPCGRTPFPASRPRKGPTIWSSATLPIDSPTAWRPTSIPSSGVSWQSQAER